MTNPSDENNTVDAILAQSPPLGLDIPEGTSFEHWLALGKHLALADNALAWRIGDWWVYGEHRYGDRITAVRTRGWNAHEFRSIPELCNGSPCVRNVTAQIGRAHV